MMKARIGIIGAGWWAVANHLPILAAASNVELGGVCRIGQTELDHLVSECGFAFGSENFEDVLDDPELDGVIIASPHHLHGKQAVAALERGVHVLVEKPAAVSLEEALALRDASRRANRSVIVPHGWNWRGYSTIARDWIAAGKIGDIRHISMQMASPAEDLFTGHGFSGAKDALFTPQAGTWADPKASGGYGWGQLPHLLGVLFQTAPQLEPEMVFGQMRAGPTGSDLYDAAVLRFEGGILGSLSGSATVPPDAPFQVDIRIFGEKGMVLIDFERARVELWCNDGERAAYPFASGEGNYICQGPVETLINICTGNGSDDENHADAELALKCTRLVDGLYQSASQNSPMNVAGTSISKGNF